MDCEIRMFGYANIDMRGPRQSSLVLLVFVGEKRCFIVSLHIGVLNVTHIAETPGNAYWSKLRFFVFVETMRATREWQKC